MHLLCRIWRAVVDDNAFAGEYPRCGSLKIVFRGKGSQPIEEKFAIETDVDKAGPGDTQFSDARYFRVLIELLHELLGDFSGVRFQAFRIGKSSVYLSVAKSWIRRMNVREKNVRV